MGGAGTITVTIALGIVMGLGTWLGFAFGVLAPFLVTDLGWSDLQAGSLTSVMYAAGAVAARGSGWVVDHLGARRTALLVPAAVLSAHAVVVGADTLPTMAAGAAVGGIALAATNPTTNRLVMEGVPAVARGRAMGWKQAGVSVAGFAAGAVLPGVASRLGWRAAAAVGLVFAVLAMPVLIWTLPRPAALPIGAPRPSSGEVRVGRIAGYAGIMGVVNGALGAYVVLYAVGTLGLSAQTGGAAVATIALVATGARVGWATWGARSGHFVALLRGISVLAVAGLMLLALTPAGGTGQLLAAAGLLGATAMSWHALAMLAAVSGVAVGSIGRVSGEVMRAFYGGYVIGPVVFGLLVDNGVGYRTAWAGLAALALVALRVPHTVSDRDDRTARARVDGGDPG